ncbi:transmembrane 4 L6 family member 20 [Trichosurus vulpecula]|uniref:transmembrane 4 L6 family member 20 n=1 Tax=Trichosurus vulpecula TaxID=9337 RepID=UPI00186AC155|nr:transmembrane 4 L6 family member 20 [Trichosurus vulpecula]
MTCCESWTSCNGFSLLVLLLLGVILNIVPLVVYKIEDGELFQNPISCFEWWYPGIIGAGALAIPATAMSLAARKRACCNNRFGMILSSFLSVVTIAGGLYCMLVSLLALFEGPLICNDNGNSSVNCEFSFKNFSDFHRFNQSFDSLKWFYSTCVPDVPSYSVTEDSRNVTQGTNTLSSEEDKLKIIHLSVFAGLLLVGVLEILFSVSQIVIGLFGCLCGVSKRRSRQTW